MKAMIFAAGLGTRLKPLTDTMPKALVPLAGQTLLEWQIRKLCAAGIHDIVINVHHFPDQIIDFVRSHDWGCRITISDERDALLETGGGLYKAMRESEPITEPWLVCNVDILSNLNYQDVMAAYQAQPSMMVVVSDRATQRYLCFDNACRLGGWTNVQTGQLKGQDGIHWAFSGMSIVTEDALPLLHDYATAHGPKFSLIDFYLSICASHTIRAYVPEDYRMMDVGKIDQLSQAESFAASL